MLTNQDGQTWKREDGSIGKGAYEQYIAGREVSSPDLIAFLTAILVQD